VTLFQAYSVAMWLLFFASLLWAPSFPLVKRLGVDPDLLSAIRLVLAALAFWALAPLSARARADSVRRLAPRLCATLVVLGAVQLGLMYLFVHRSYAHLAGHEVALFTVLTPLWVAVLDGLAERTFRVRPFLAALLASAGSLFLCDLALRPEALTGFLLVQGANVCFAFGTVVYRRIDLAVALPHAVAFRWLYLGAAAVALVAALVLVPRSAVEELVARPLETHMTLLYLGLVPTAIGFHLWNRGAARVSAGTLAAANQLKVPLAVLVALAPPFNESADPARLAAASAVIAAALVLGRE
jgi:drug/metabolite transporter (DMT)-like permease